MRMTRRRALAGLGGLGVALGGLESASLAGAFDNRKKLPATALDRYRASLEAVTRGGASDTSIVHIGHSTHLVCVAGLRVLTDPWFSDPAFGALAHACGPAATVETLGPLDAIVISHDHPDHADLGALDRVGDKRRVAALVSDASLARRLRARGFSEVHSLDEWEVISLRGVQVHAVPALHDVHELGYVLEAPGQRVYFAGDTQLCDAHDEIAERLAPTSAILPVDGTRIRTGGRWVMGPNEALRAAQRLGVRHVMPSHAEARVSDPVVERVLLRTVSEAARKLDALVAAALPDVTCHLPEPGERVLLT